MVSVTLEDITNVASEFEDVDEEVANFYIEIARELVSEGRWGTKAKRGIMLMAMHLMSINGIGANAVGNVGAVVSESVGGVSTTYDVSNGAVGTDPELGQTSYGRMFLLLRRTIIATPLVT